MTKRLYGGNVSAVIAELSADAALLEGMHDHSTWISIAVHVRGRGDLHLNARTIRD